MPFLHQTLAEPAIVRPSSLEVADIDADGDHDLVVASEENGGIRWFANDGNGKFDASGGNAELISDLAGIQHLQVLDMDGDGDEDVVAVSYETDRIAWFENSSDGKFEVEHTITDAIFGPTSAVVEDLDGDGDLDVLVTVEGYGSVYWLEKTDAPDAYADPQLVFEDQLSQSVVATAVAQQPNSPADIFIVNEDVVVVMEAGSNEPKYQFEREDFESPVNFFTSDFDSDGDVDLRLIGYEPNSSSYESFTYTDGTFRSSGGLFDEEQLAILNTRTYPLTDVEFADLNGDGTQEMLLVSTRNHMVAQHVNGQRGFGPRELIFDNGLPEVSNLVIADLDGDQQLDVLANSRLDRELSWLKNEGEARFAADKAIVETASTFAGDHLVVYDADGDGDHDIVGADTLTIDIRLERTVVWSNNGEQEFGEPAQFSNQPQHRLNQGVSYQVADVDQNGIDDLLAIYVAPEEKQATKHLIRFEAPTTREVLQSFKGAESSSILQIDLDQDGDIDILTTANHLDAETGSESRVTWLENLDGRGNFSQPILITDQSAGARSVHASDIDGDGDLDVIVSAMLDGKIVWHENQKGFFAVEPHVVTRRANLVRWLASADMDLDGDVDLIAGSAADRNVTWLENDGQGTFTAAHEVAANIDGLGDVAVFDADADGDSDIVTASFHAGRVDLYRNDVEPVGVRGDVTGDELVNVNDIDTLCSVLRSGQNRDLTDLTGNGITDRADLAQLLGILNAGPGDVNLDGQFNSADLVEVFQFGQYEDGIAENSGWAEGDWNCDGDFSTADLVAAFQTGSYVATARLIQVAVRLELENGAGQIHFADSSDDPFSEKSKRRPVSINRDVTVDLIFQRSNS